MSRAAAYFEERQRGQGRRGRCSGRRNPCVEVLSLSLLLGCSRSSPDEGPRSGDDSAEPARAAADDVASVRNETLVAGDRAAVREAYRSATGRDLEEEGCVEWSTHFPRVVVVGSFAYDRGCMSEGLFVDGQWHGGRSDEAVKAGLATRGWAEADPSERQGLARDWIDSVVQVFGGRFVRESTTAFVFEDTPTFEPIRVTSTGEAGVLVSGWVADPSGMAWEEGYRFVEYRFDGEGALTTTSSRGFAVSGERITEHEAGSNPAPVQTPPATPQGAPPSPSPPSSRQPAPSRATAEKPTPAPDPPAARPSERAFH